MKVGFVGLGKLGMPCAMVAATEHNVVGFDTSREPAKILQSRVYPHREQMAQQYLERTSLRIAERIEDIVEHADLIFCAVQTPHAPMYEGVTPLPQTREDFDYWYLRRAAVQISEATRALGKEVTLSIISTVLPGTCAREILPVLDPRVRLTYNPFFIAMGTTIPDYLSPEFILLGVGDSRAAEVVRGFYDKITKAPVIEMSIASAELTKVLYNTFIGLKITVANTAMQVCHELGANVDDVMGALGRADKRLISTRYLRAGMGDGGGCHPRDNIALSWLSRKLGMGYDLFGDVMSIREKQTEWLAEIALKTAASWKLPVAVLGKSFKPETAIMTGSPAILLRNLLAARGVNAAQWDPEVDGGEPPWTAPAVFVLATAHESLLRWPLPEGSHVIDPWGLYEDRPGVTVTRVGRAR